MKAWTITALQSESQLEQVAEGVFDFDIRAAEAKGFIKDPAHIMMLAVSTNLVVGMASAVLIRHPDKRNELWINEIGVGDHYRGQGMAPALLEALFAWARTHECQNVWLLMDEGNLSAERSYRKLSPSSERRDTVMFEWSLKPASDE